MSKIIECVPNFSEGKDQIKINKIVDSISSIKGVFILDVDPGEDTNRTVLTMVGDPDSILEAAYIGIKTASEVSVLYLQVPNDMVGGRLTVYNLDGTTECVKPKVGKLFKFDGRLPHSVGITMTDFERTSLVLESYNLEEWEYELIPQFHIDGGVAN